MKKKSIVVWFVAVAVAWGTCTSAGCGNVNHQHNFNRQVTELHFLEGEATHAAKARYFYSCECGEKGTETFEYGEIIPHVFNRQVTETKFLESEATHAAKARYFYSCECGEKSAETFEYGEVIPHTFDKQIMEDRYLKSAATYTEKAVYYYSCECGEINEQTFEYGEVLQPTEGLQYKLNEAGTEYSVTGIGSANETDIVIPYDYNGIPVTGIANSAFDRCKKRLASVTIPDSVTVIGYDAFAFCSWLTRMTIPVNITSIGDGAFYECCGLTDITIPNGVTSIGKRTFYGCKGMERITIPESTTSIISYALYNCTNLTEITFKGTKKQWLAIEKGNQWDYDTGNYTVTCSDGKLDKYGNEIA